MSRATVVFDTNVLVAELGFPDEPEACVALAESDAVEAVVSTAILREFAAVLGYDRLALAPRARSTAVERAAAVARLVEPAVSVEAAADPDDDAILECALAAAADAVVTDDAHLLELGAFAGTEMLSREAFLVRFADRPTERPHRNREG
ncbi:putative toxin-antitoxin system toxin component, PIN family [Halorussus amylolyticus]|uniref:putative toxin-antitoxin system toxin component, PIN family n=1 Tax=Halorussus amylolyticus TaxID=1126242 RepID=UPI00138F9A68|nr:putative toxin-antitoxin system toxin component, PIN family [Halorussus amylolyticus]